MNLPVYSLSFFFNLITEIIMAVIWIIEKSCTRQAQVTAGLLGDFAVRVFASFENALRIAKMRGGARPELVLINMPSDSIDASSLTETLSIGPKVCLLGRSWDEWRDARFQYIASWSDAFDLTSQLKRLVRDSEKRGINYIITYKDLELDTEHFELSIPLAESKESLPKKEALILKLLLQRPGECLTRQEIKRKVWSDLVVTERTIDCHVSRLRKRLASSETSIQSVYGGGYILT